MLDGQVVYIICIGETGDIDTPYAISYGRLFADELNRLPAGEYQFIGNGESVFAVSQNTAVQVYGPQFDDETGIVFPAFESVDISGQKLVALSDSESTMKIPRTSRAMKKKQLDVPFVANIS